jgi:dTDP-glucose 4,6-dehydratase
MTILVTGGAGFIGANFVLDWLADRAEPVVNLDRLTYAGSLTNLATLEGDPRHSFVRGDIGDGPLVAGLLRRHRPRAIVHFAAESHVARAIAGPADFVQTNIVGTFQLLEETLRYLDGPGADERKAFRFLHVSTDEVFGSFADGDSGATEHSAYRPNNPYSASKAASDHLVRAYHRTYGLPVLTTNCSNNYGPMQASEKFIPVVIARACAGEPIPIYGDGQNMRDWLYVADHCSALRAVLDKGRIGESYNIAAGNEARNIDLAKAICALLEELSPRAGCRYADLIISVADRPGHDFRYALDAGKIGSELGWQPRESFETGLRKTVSWYLERLGAEASGRGKARRAGA